LIFLLISLIAFVSVPSLPGAAVVELGALTVPVGPTQARRAGVCRAVPGRAPAQMVIGRPLLALPVVRLSSKQQSQEQRCSAVQYWAPTGS